ncbi:hypothetical protein P152DRAFT_474223 [Eremomyces bilateralis CBS 781.70]|uniref:N-acetyltransferase domain-containing protein n=1 Tax=Eremomyces bilateralis CBS 781.70 TaxID=1392243 RepID=A0A6G1G235_9PEZI|nr:uncharacterized protein P152DRAFT_474223 [Eremomyces bilateralis CBS 781.70]KAF1811986.1 hypothetical protein P152DRAFT_474223 [Eremomyces bilateralis CBS 781.70]
MANIKAVEGNAEDRQRISTVYTRAFAHDPVIEYMLGMTPEKKSAYLPKYFDYLTVAASLNKGLFFEANDWSSCAVCMPPQQKIDSPRTLIPSGLIWMTLDVGIASSWRMISEFPSAVGPAKKKGLGNQKDFYYLFFIATDPDHQGQGLASAIIRVLQERAGKEGLPIWLEATTTKSRDTYQRLGFKEVEEVRAGKGKVNADGIREKDGKGVPLWAMIWWPESKA